MGYRGDKVRWADKARTAIGSGGLVVAGLGLSVVLVACGSAGPTARPPASLGAADVSTTPTTASPSVTPTTASPSAKPSVAPTHHSAKPAAVTDGCYPLSDEGTCYEPGEYCRDDDHGVTGRAGDGETITCEDNDGWRWEPA
jgi:hypothetical protein